MRFIFLCLFISHLVSVAVNGFSIKLIHRDSPESPLYPGYLTLEQTLSRLQDQISSYTSHVTNQSEIVGPTSIRPPVTFRSTYYMAVVGIGTFDPPEIKYKNTYLLVDSGSELIWTQCEGCRNCFPQSNPYYPYTQSKSFRNIPCGSHQLCYPGKCIDGKCTYQEGYAGHSGAQGFLATELFTFNSDSGGTEELDLVFGCGFDQSGFAFAQNNQNPITGILRLGSGPRSLINQLGSRSLGLMSYCIPHWGANPAISTFLKFGFDADFKPGTQFRTTLLLMNQGFKHPYVELLDISVAGHHLNYPAGTFDRINGKGGCVLDTGSPVVFIKKDAYTRLRAAIEYYFAPLRVQPESKFGFDLCYSRQGAGLDAINDNFLPAITFHLRNADLETKSGVFLILPDYLCLTVNPHEYDFVSVIIGNMAQSNYRFLYDLTHRTVSFAPETCELGS